MASTLHALADRLAEAFVPRVEASAESYTYKSCSSTRCAVFWRQEYWVTCYYSSQGASCSVSGWVGCGC